MTEPAVLVMALMVVVVVVVLVVVLFSHLGESMSCLYTLSMSLIFNMRPSYP